MAGELTPERIIALITTASTVIIAIWTKFGQSKDTSFNRLEQDRARTAADRDTALSDLEACEQKAEAEKEKREKIQQENAFFLLERREILNFLGDITTGYYDGDAQKIKTRATELHKRFDI